jgi:hypothetical protein
LQTIEASSFITNPIIFGDFIKVGAAREDRVYEDLSVVEKVKASMADVSSVIAAVLRRCACSKTEDVHGALECA